MCSAAGGPDRLRAINWLKQFALSQRCVTQHGGTVMVTGVLIAIVVLEAIIIFYLLFRLGSLTQSTIRQNSRIRAGQNLPFSHLQFSDGTSKSITGDANRQYPLVITFLSAICEPCTRLYPVIRANPHVLPIVLGTESDAKSLMTTLARDSVAYVDADISEHVPGVPTSLAVDSNGRALADSVPGPDGLPTLLSVYA